MASNIFVDIQVSPLVYHFYHSKSGCNKIKLQYNDPLSLILYSMLETVPATFRHERFENTIRIELIYKRNQNIQYINYLPPRKQEVISKHLYANIKHLFHNYVLAFVSAGGSQHEAIIDFCTYYNIPLEDVKYETLKKSWNRSEEKRKFFR